MTAILTCLTHRFAIQASDRRLTRPDGTIFEDEENKAVFYQDFAVFAYTGLARLHGGGTDDWLARALAEGTQFTDSVEQLRRRANQAFRSVPLPGSTRQRAQVRRTAFVACGFVGLRYPERLGRASVGDELHPMMLRVSNAISPSGAWLDAAEREFRVDLAYLPESESFLLYPTGQPLDERELLDLR